MLKNLHVTDNDKPTFSEYLRNTKHSPFRLTALAAVGAIPVAALVWWYYSFVMSVGAFGPLRLVNETADVTAPVAEQQSVETTIDSSSVQSSSSASSDDSLNVNISSSSNSTSSSVEVNGQTVTVPDQGSTHQVIEDVNGRTTVDISVDSNTSGSSKTRSSTNIDVDSSARSKVKIDLSSREDF
ncbi:MAG TPA: hypothetical protein VF281_02685 [Candidatus Saccharimonadales bacterium]